LPFSPRNSSIADALPALPSGANFLREGTAHLDTAWHRGPVNALVRFYQAEWLSRLPARCEWKYFFRDGKNAGGESCARRDF